MSTSGDLLILLSRKGIAVVRKLLVEWRAARIEHDPNALAGKSAGDTQYVIAVVLRELQLRNGRISMSSLQRLENRPLVLVAWALAAIDCAAGPNVKDGDDARE